MLISNTDQLTFPRRLQAGKISALLMKPLAARITDHLMNMPGITRECQAFFFMHSLQGTGEREFSFLISGNSPMYLRCPQPFGGDGHMYL